MHEQQHMCQIIKSEKFSLFRSFFSLNFLIGRIHDRNREKVICWYKHFVCVRLKYSGMWCSVNGQKVADISGGSSWTALPWWWLHHDHLKQWELLAHWHNMISQKTQAFIKYCCDLISHTVCLFTHYGDMKLTTLSLSSLICNQSETENMLLCFIYEAVLMNCMFYKW